MSLLRRSTLAAIGAWGLIAAGLGPAATATPFLPADDDEILERVPASSDTRKTLRQLRRTLQEDPSNRALAIDLAQRYIELGHAESDPRYNGYAEAVLAPWLNPTNPLPEALVLRAMLRQNRHDFSGALSDLSAALARQPHLVQAWLTRAVVLEVQGDYPAALGSCRALARLSTPLVATVCLNSALSLAGHADFAYQRLDTALQHAAGTPDERVWARTVAAEIAERLGRLEDADRHYRAGLDLPVRSVYLLMAYSDFLLDREKPQAVVTLLHGETRIDSLLLRLTLAEQRLHAPDYESHHAALTARFAASRLRGDVSHRGDEARFQLQVARNAPAALELAIANWAVQREPRDARLLLEAALAAKDPRAAQPVISHVAQSHLQDQRLDGLIRRLQQAMP